MVHNGVLVPLEPLPEDWGEGQEFDIRRNGGEPATSAEPAEDDARWAAIERAAAEITSEDFQRMQAALDEADRQAKDWMRRRMGLT
jgi:hypothetical protein